MDEERQIRPVTVFYSYAPEDELLRQALEKHLSILRRQGFIAEWYDQKVAPGADRAQTIQTHLMNASVFLLLISPDFIASDYHYSVEIQYALERYEAKSAQVIPILLRPVDLEGSPFSHLPCLPTNRRPVTTWSNQDKAFLDIARGIRGVIEKEYFGQDKDLLPALSGQEPERLRKRSYLCMAGDAPLDFVARPHEFEGLKRLLLNPSHEQTVAITAALLGAGGYGKTTLARALCHDSEIQAAFPDGILWLTFGEMPGNLISKIEDLIYILERERPGFTTLEAAIAWLKKIVEHRRFLLVLDDVWNAADIKPLLQMGSRGAQLITTRNETVLPMTAQLIQVDAMRMEEAAQLLCAGLIKESESTATNNEMIQATIARLGEWPLLLTLANSVLRERIERYQQSLLEALVYLNRVLDKRGLTAFDAKNATERNQAVAKTLEVSFAMLDANEYARYQELAIFPEDAAIPLATVYRLWSVTGQLDDLDTELLCQRLHELSLLLDFNIKTQQIRLHDVIRSYLQNKPDMEMSELHARLLDTYHIERWAHLPLTDRYMWDHLAFHLMGARRSDGLLAAVKDLHYQAKKIFLLGVASAEADLRLAATQFPGDGIPPLLMSSLEKVGHLLQRGKTVHEVECTLLSHISHLQELAPYCNVLEQELARPYLKAWHPLPGLLSPDLLRTLQGHTKEVSTCAINPRGNLIISGSIAETGIRAWDTDKGREVFRLEGHTRGIRDCIFSASGMWIISASEDKTLKLWNVVTRAELLTLRGHTGAVSSCAISPAEDWIVSASEDKTLKLWDARTGAERLSLVGHQGRVTACAISPAGDWIVSASLDKTLKLWDVQTGQELRTLRGHAQEVTACAISPAGDWIVSASGDETLKLWDVRTGTEIRTLTGHVRSVVACVIAPDGQWLVSASKDKTLKLWKTEMENKGFTARGHTDAIADCAINPAGSLVVSASYDKTLKLWDASTNTELRTFQGHSRGVVSCAIHPNGNWLVSASEDRTLKLWDIHSGMELRTFQGHSGAIRGCAIHPNGNWLASASLDRTLKLWDIHTGTELRALRGHSGAVRDCAIHPNGNWLVSASEDKTLKLWDVHTGRELRTFQGHAGAVISCAVSSQNDWLVSSSWDLTLKSWDMKTGAELRTFKGHTGAVIGCAVSLDGNWISSTADNGTIKIWNSHTGECAVTLQVDGELYACSFFPDGKHLVVAGETGLSFFNLML